MAISDSASDCSPRESGVSQPMAAVQLNILAEAADRVQNGAVDESCSIDSSSRSSDSGSMYNSEQIDSPTVMATPIRTRENLGKTSVNLSKQLDDFSAGFRHVDIAPQIRAGPSNIRDKSSRLQRELEGLENEAKEYEGDDGMPPTPDYLDRRYAANESEDRYYDSWEDEECSNRFIILKTTYPSHLTFRDFPVINDGEMQMNGIIRCLMYYNEKMTVLGPPEGFVGWEEAINAARIERDKLSIFDGFEEIDGPPWQESDGRQTVTIDTVDYEEYLEHKNSLPAYKDYFDEKMENYQNVYDIEMGRMIMGVTKTKAFYSYPKRKMWNVPADMEIRETENWREDMLKKIRPDAGGMRSLMYCGNARGSLGRFLNFLHDYNDGNYVAEEFGLLRHVRSIDNLEELYLEIDLRSLGRRDSLPRPLTEIFIHELASKMRNLKVLSFGPGLVVLPEVFEAIGNSFSSLERLDISYALSNRYPIEGEIAPGDEQMYYESAVPLCVVKLKSLVRLDIGESAIPDEDDSVILSSNAIDLIERVLKERGGRLTQSFETLPPFWPKEFGKKSQHHAEVIVNEKIVQDTTKDPDLRNLAHLRLNQLRASLVAPNRNMNGGGDSQKPVVIEEKLDESPSSHQEATVASNSSHKRRHEQEELTPDGSKITRLT